MRQARQRRKVYMSYREKEREKKRVGWEEEEEEMEECQLRRFFLSFLFIPIFHLFLSPVLMELQLFFTVLFVICFFLFASFWFVYLGGVSFVFFGLTLLGLLLTSARFTCLFLFA